MRFMAVRIPFKSKNAIRTCTALKIILSDQLYRKADGNRPGKSEDTCKKQIGKIKSLSQKKQRLPNLYFFGNL